MVEGVGHVKLPLTPTGWKELIKSSRLAPFGMGESTVVDTNVRNTWEIDAKQHVTFQNHGLWNAYLNEALQSAKLELGLDENLE